MGYDLVLVFFGALALGMFISWVYYNYGKWTTAELVDAVETIKDNKHFQAHLKAHPELKKKFGDLYEYLLPVEGEEEDPEKK